MAEIAPSRLRFPETLKLVTAFLGILAVAAGPGYAAARLTGLTANGGAFVSSCLAWTPGFAALVALRLYGRLQSWDFELRRARWRYCLVAVALPMLVMSVVYGSVWVSGLAAFAGGAARPSFMGVPALAMAGTGFGILLGAAGEELGWRGFLVPVLARRCSFPAIVWISWVCWFVYSMPAILPADQHSAAPLAFRLVTYGTILLALSIMLAWLRLVSGSLWPAILLHAAHRFLIRGIFDPLTVGGSQSAWITGEFGAGVAAAYLPIAWILLVNGARSHGHTAAAAGTA